MIGGVGWWKQITEALDRVEILIMVMTPAALQSEIAAKEWHYARQQGVRVCPVMRAGLTLDASSIPNWMRKAHFYDVDREWETFIGFLRSASKVTRVPYMAPDLPVGYVERPEPFELVLSRLLDGARANPQPVTIALQGVGGFGKTTLANIICHDEDIITAFDDGILWTSLGETPDVQSELTKLYAALTGERSPFIDIDDASIQLAERLDQKNCLLVIDDVWDPNHLRPFLRGGAQSARLITTRQLRVAIEANATRIVVDKMTEEQGVTLLMSRMPPASQQQEALRALAERLGGWPLLLRLAGSQLRERVERGDSLAGAINYLNRALDRRGVVAFDQKTSTARNDAVASTVAASLELFGSGDQARCAELAVFRADAPFLLDAVSVLWDMDSFDAEDLLLRLDNAALLDFDLKTASIQIHRVLLSYLQSRVEDTKILHERLISRWLRDPFRLPDDYAWMWIGWHLEQAGKAEKLKQLLLNFDWLTARLAVIPVQAALQDFDLLGEEPDTRVVRDALRLASHGLTFDSDQLRIQLGGRIDRGHSPIIDALLDSADASKARPRLSIADTSLTHPGGALTGIVKSHGGTVEAMAISPDGRWLVTGSEDWTVRLWDLDVGSVVRAFEGHAGIVHTVAFAPDGKWIISGSEDRTIRIWNVGGGQVFPPLRGHTLAVQDIALSRGGTVAASVSEDGTVRLWNLVTRKSEVVYRGRDHQLNAVAITAEGTTLYFGAGDWTVRWLNLRERTEGVLAGHSGIVRSLGLSSGEDFLLSGADDATIGVWSLPARELVHTLRGHTASVEAVAVTSDGALGVSGSRDKTLRIWDLRAGVESRILEGHSGYVRAIAISPTTGSVLSGSTDKTIRYWDIETVPRDQPRSRHLDAVMLIALSADGTEAISGTEAGDVALWDITDVLMARHELAADDRIGSPRVVGRLEGHTDRIHALQMTADGQRAVTASRDRTLRVWDLSRRACTQVLKGHRREVLALDMSVDGRHILSLSRDRTLRYWDAESGRSIAALVTRGDERAVAAFQVDDAMLAELDVGPRVDVCDISISKGPLIALSPDGHRAVLASQGRIGLWDLVSGRTHYEALGDLEFSVISFDSQSTASVMGTLFGPIVYWDFHHEPRLMEGHSGTIRDVVLAVHGKTAISGGKDDTIRMWDIRSGNQIGCINGPSGRSDAVVIAPDGLLAYSVYAETVVAFDLETTCRVASLSVDHQITAIAVSPSGRRVVIGDQAGQVHHLCLQR